MKYQRNYFHYNAFGWGCTVVFTGPGSVELRILPEHHTVVRRLQPVKITVPRY